MPHCLSCTSNVFHFPYTAALSYSFLITFISGSWKYFLLLCNNFWHVEGNIVNLKWRMWHRGWMQHLRQFLSFLGWWDTYWIYSTTPKFIATHLWVDWAYLASVKVCVRKLEMSPDMTVSPDWTQLMLCQPDCLCLPSGFSMKINDPWMAVAFCTKRPRVSRSGMFIPKGRYIKSSHTN